MNNQIWDLTRNLQIMLPLDEIEGVFRRRFKIEENWVFRTCGNPGLDILAVSFVLKRAQPMNRRVKISWNSYSAECFYLFSKPGTHNTEWHQWFLIQTIQTFWFCPRPLVQMLSNFTIFSILCLRFFYFWSYPAIKMNVEKYLVSTHSRK